MEVMRNAALISHSVFWKRYGVYVKAARKFAFCRLFYLGAYFYMKYFSNFCICYREPLDETSIAPVGDTECALFAV